MKDILKNILTIAAVKGANAKQDMMRELESEDLKRVFEYALNPYKMYGVKSFEIGNTIVGANTWEEPEQLFKTLDALTWRKVSGKAAREECAFVCNKYRIPQELLLMILNKDLRCGVAATTVNKVWPGLIPDFKVALAEEYDPEADGPWLGSIKYDGLRCIALIDDSGVPILYTRNGLEITSANHIESALMSLGKTNIMFDGELMKSDGHFQDSSGSIRSKSKQDTSLVYRIFDWLPLEEFQTKTCKLSQMDRWMWLSSFGNPETPKCLQLVAHSWLSDDAQVQGMYKVSRLYKHEGLILKKPDAPYSFRRSNSWMKLKDMVTVDVRVTGIEEGKGRLSGTMGKLIVDFEGKPNKVGSGFSDLERARYWDSPHHIVGKLIEVAYHELTKDGNMRHSRFVKERWDKE